MRSYLSILALSGALGILSASAEDKAESVNTPPKGFTALYNGKDLTGWQGLIPILQRQKLKADPAAYDKAVKAANAKVLSHWKVQPDGVLYYDGKSDSLQTVKDYGDIELYLDWKIAPKGDSGLYLRGQPQVQIWDSETAPGARGKDKDSGSGGLWNNPEEFGKRPLVKADKPVGEWNTFHIIMKGDKVTVKLNGKLVVDKQPLQNYFAPKSPLPKKGPIELQHHGDPLWFRNIYIKELDAE
jgi:Domain of Unknown Function (DUF1080)